MNKLKLAACGIDCNECGLPKAEHDIKAAEGLVAWFRSAGWIEPNGNAEAVQKAIQNKKPYCNGCWENCGWCGCGKVDFRKCCVEKEINHCGECGDFPCESYKDWVEWTGSHKTMEYLQSLRDGDKNALT
jgi:hypothetical protein